MKIIFYSDSKYEYQAKALIESILINSKNTQMIYYTIGFESSISHPNLTKRIFPIDIKKTRFEFYKPSILIDAIECFGGKFLFLDVDIIIGKRFSISKIDHNFDFPMMSCGNWDYPFTSSHENGSITNIGDESELMKYFGVSKRSMNYVYTCVISFNEKCKDILLEWKSMCENEFLLQRRIFYFPLADETPMNIILWKRGIDRNFGRIYLNTLDIEPLKYVEENDNVVGDNNINYGIFGSPLMRCDNSSLILLYHGIKDDDKLSKVINYLKK